MFIVNDINYIYISVRYLTLPKKIKISNVKRNNRYIIFNKDKITT